MCKPNVIVMSNSFLLSNAKLFCKHAHINHDIILFSLLLL